MLVLASPLWLALVGCAVQTAATTTTYSVNYQFKVTIDSISWGNPYPSMEYCLQIDSSTTLGMTDFPKKFDSDNDDVTLLDETLTDGTTFGSDLWRSRSKKERLRRLSSSNDDMNPVGVGCVDHVIGRGCYALDPVGYYYDGRNNRNFTIFETYEMTSEYIDSVTENGRTSIVNYELETRDDIWSSWTPHESVAYCLETTCTSTILESDFPDDIQSDENGSKLSITNAAYDTSGRNTFGWGDDGEENYLEQIVKSTTSNAWRSDMSCTDSGNGCFLSTPIGTYADGKGNTFTIYQCEKPRYLSATCSYGQECGGTTNYSGAQVFCAQTRQYDSSPSESLTGGLTLNGLGEYPDHYDLSFFTLLLKCTDETISCKLDVQWDVECGDRDPNGHGCLPHPFGIPNVPSFTTNGHTVELYYCGDSEWMSFANMCSADLCT